MPLKGIPAIISPELLFTLASAGHGDEIILADAHFPTSSICKNGPKEIRADGHTIPVLLDAVLSLFPLDKYETPVHLMDLVPGDKAGGLATPNWDLYKQLVNKHEQVDVPVGLVERFQFYERANKAYAIVHTGDLGKYGNIILKKGLVES